jgi:hypothetical protein
MTPAGVGVPSSPTATDILGHYVDANNSTSSPNSFSTIPCTMGIESTLSLSNPVFRTYVLCVVALSLKMSFLAWHTVYRMMSSARPGCAIQKVHGSILYPG